jgi:signal transduction histidine kinase
MRFERHHSALIVASLVTVASFVGATVYTQNRLVRLDALSSTIETNAVPSTEYLSRAAVRLTRLSQLLDDGGTGRLRAPAEAAAAREVDALDADVSAYLKLSPLAGENQFWASLRTDVFSAVQLVRAALDQEAHGVASADLGSGGRVDEALDRAVRTVLATLSFDIRQSEKMARDVRDVRLATLHMIIVLDGLSTAIAIVAVVIAYRASRRHDELLNEHNALLTARVTELDRFAGRVAHDVLSPLGTISSALALLGQSAEEPSRPYINRSSRALERVQQLVQALLTFARSGARPDPAARCSVNAVLGSIVADSVEPAEKQNIDIAVQTSGLVMVPCSIGVITSIVQNLVRNAIKYMGDRPVKRVVVRVRALERVARLEVEDTGPGIPPEAQQAIFEPFVRVARSQVAGTGLGLATVKRLVEAHGGRLGVRSKPDAGSLFWVELPLVSVDPAGRTY